MRKLLATVMSLLMVATFSATVGSAQTSCPPEVASAKAMLAKQTAKSQDVQAPRSLAGARSQDVQAPRSQDVQAPRGQDIQAPRSQNIQAPRSQDVQAPRTQVAQSPRSAEFNKAATLVKEAEAACKAGNMTMASDKAKAAMELLKSK